MGNLITTDDKTKIIEEKNKEICQLNEKLENLSKKFAELNIKYSNLANITTSEYIDKYVDNWFEKNKDDVDIGEVTIAGSIKVDLLPDELEKRIYKKILKIALSFMSEFNY